MIKSVQGTAYRNDMNVFNRKKCSQLFNKKKKLIFFNHLKMVVKFTNV